MVRKAPFRWWRRLRKRRDEVGRSRRRHVIDSELALGPEERRETAAVRDWTRI
jgi:hypothetical protein